MKIKSAAFTVSNTDYRKCPQDGLPEFAFIGRSNVGKSSLINLLCGRKKLAHASAAPGKTQTINHFLVNGSVYLVDLPGYGFAKSSRTQRDRWQRSTWNYLQHRASLVTTFVLVDAGVPPQEPDLQFINRLGEARLPFSLVFTKTDRLTPAALKKSIEAFGRAMLACWEALPPVFITSAKKGTGKQQLLDYIAKTSAETSAEN